MTLLGSEAPWWAELCFSFQDGLLLRSQPPRHQYPSAPHIHVLPGLGCDVLQRSWGEGLQIFQREYLLSGNAVAHPLPVHHARPVHDRVPPTIFRLWPLQVLAFAISFGQSFLSGVEMGMVTRRISYFFFPPNSDILVCRNWALLDIQAHYVTWKFLSKIHLLIFSHLAIIKGKITAPGSVRVKYVHWIWAISV